MARLVTFEGATHSFPDDFSDQDISIALETYKGPETRDVIRAVPGEIKRQLAEGVSGVVQAAGDVLSMPSWQDEASGARRAIREERAEEIPPGMSLGQEALLSAGTSLAVGAPALALGALTAPISGPAAAAGLATTLMGVQTGFQKYGETRDMFGPGRSAFHGFIHGLVEKYTEYIPLKDLMSGPLAMRTAYKFLGQELVGEEAATLLQDLNDKASTRPDLTLGDWLHDAAVTALSVGIAAPVQVGAVKGIQATLAPFLKPEKLTEEQRLQLLNAVAGQETQVQGAPNVDTAGQILGAVQQLAEKPQIDMQDLLLPDKAPPLPAGQQRVYTTIPEGVSPPENLVWTTAVEKVQQAVEVMGVNTRVLALDVTPEVLGGWQEGEVPEKIRLDMQVVPGVDYVVPSTQIPHAHVLYSPAAAPVSQGQTGVPPSSPPGVPPATPPSGDPLPPQGEKVIIRTRTPEGERKTSVTFPAAKERDLFVLGKRLKEGKSGPGVEDREIVDRIILATGWTPDFTRLAAARYFATVTGVARAGGEVATAPEFSPENAEKLSAEQLRLKQLEKMSELAKAGEVVFGTGFTPTPNVRRLKAFLDQWLRRFTPGGKIVVVGVGPRASLVRAFGVSFITLPDKNNRMESILSTAHEFGHHIKLDVLDNPEFVEVQADLRLEWQGMLDRVEGMTALEFVENYMAPHRVLKAEQYLEGLGVAPDMPSAAVVAAVNARGLGDILSFDEYLAEQFARYVAKKPVLSTDKVRKYWSKAVEKVKEFFDKVVAKLLPQPQFYSWLDRVGLDPQPVLNARAAQVRSTDTFFDLADEGVELTLKVLNRLPKKDRVQKLTVLSELNRGDVKDQERELVGEVLNSFEGEVVPREWLVEAVMGRLVPLGMVWTDQWADYGVGRVASSSVDRSTAKTIIFQLPFELSTANHFQDPRYFGHARTFDHEDTVPVSRDGKVRQVVEGSKARHVVELQSDLVQKMKGDEDTPEGMQKKIKELEETALERDKSVLYWQEQAAEFRTNPLQEEGHETGDYTQPKMVDGQYPPKFVGYGYLRFTNPIVGALKGIGAWDKVVDEGRVQMKPPLNLLIAAYTPTPDELQHIHASLVENSERSKLSAQEARVQAQALRDRMALNIPAKIQVLPKRWWEFMLRKLNVQAAKDGVKRMRMATADTVAKVEGWPVERVATIPTLKGRKVARIEGQVDILTGVVKFVNNRWMPEIEQDQALIDPANLQDQEEFPLTMFQPTEQQIRMDYGRNQGIYNRYASEVTKFVKREFGAKEVVGDTYNYGSNGIQGATWLEWDVKPEVANLPQEYYDLAENVNEATERLSRVVVETGIVDDVPEIPTYIKRFQGFFNGSLQLIQMAKLLPRFMPLQLFKRGMQSMANMKNRLMEGPNDRIKEWYSLSKKDSLGVMQMIRDEVAGGSHWTELVQVPITVRGAPMAIWTHQLTAKVGLEAKKLGLSERAVRVYLGVKNDLLTTLGTMEETALNSVEDFFRENPTSALIRKAAIVKEFTTLRAAPYFPDRRFGQWSVVVRSKKDAVVGGRQVKKGEVVHYSGHRRRRMMDKEFAELRTGARFPSANFAVSAEYTEESQYVLRSLPREFVRQLPEKLGLTVEQLEKWEQLFYDVTKEGAYLKMFTKEKKGVTGAEQDLRMSYADYMWRTANLISKMSHSRQLQRELYKVDRAANELASVGGDVVPLRRLHEYMGGFYDYVMRPQHEWEQLRAWTSLWYLWGVPKTALMNMSTLATTTYPRLAALSNDAIATKEILKAMKDVVGHWKSGGKDSEIAQLLAQGRHDGVTTQSFAAELAAVTDENAIERILPSFAFLRDSGLHDRVRKATWKSIHMGMLPFRVAEQINRQVTLVAAYRIAKLQGKPGINVSTTDGSAYLDARDTVDFTQNDYSPWNRAPFLRGKKSVFLIFYSFLQHMVFFMGGGDKGWLRAWLILAMLAGLQGLPAADNFIDVLNWLGRKFLGKQVDLRVEAREFAQGVGLNPDFFMHGVSHSMLGLGWDTSASLGLGRIIPGTDAVFGQGDFNQRFTQAAGEIGGPFFSLTIGIMQALVDDNPNALLRWDRALPPVLRNMERSVHAAETGEWQDRRGRALVDEVSGVELIGQALGFQPTSKAQEQELRFTQREVAQYYVIRRTNLLSALFQATRSGDGDAIADAKEAIVRYNEQVPDAQLRVSADDMRRSVRARSGNQDRIEHGEPLTERYRGVYEAVREAFGR